MKNFKERFNKIKFLIIFIIGTILAIFVGQVRDMGIISGITVFGLTILSSVGQYRMTFDKEYRERAEEFIRKEKQLPWHERRSGSDLSLTLFCLQIIAPAIAVFLIIHFLFSGFSKGIWNMWEINYIVFFLIIFIICRLAFKAK